MNEAVKNLRHKDYNPCGELTGVEREICDEATKNFPNLPFSEVMRAVAVKAVAKLEHEKNFPNEAALIDWSLHELNQVEWHVVVQFGDSSPLEVGLSKYVAHVLYENRYNIHYNALLNYCRTLDEKAFATGLPAEQLEQKIDSLAKEADYSTKVNDLIEQLHNFIKGSGSICLSDIVTTIFDVFT